MDLHKLVEESGQILLLFYNGKFTEVTFMWFHNGNIEVISTDNIRIISVSPKNWYRLSI